MKSPPSCPFFWPRNQLQEKNFIAARDREGLSCCLNHLLQGHHFDLAPRVRRVRMWKRETGQGWWWWWWWWWYNYFYYHHSHYYSHYIWWCLLPLIVDEATRHRLAKPLFLPPRTSCFRRGSLSSHSSVATSSISKSSVTAKCPCPAFAPKAAFGEARWAQKNPLYVGLKTYKAGVTTPGLPIYCIWPMYRG